MVGEYGSINTPNFSPTDNAWILLQLETDFIDPVVIGGVPTAADSDEVVVRFRNLRRGQSDCLGWCVDMMLQEPGCRDGMHRSESVAWMVIERGTFEMEHVNSRFAAGTLEMRGGLFYDVDIGLSIGLVPSDDLVVLTQVQTFNDAQFVKTRQRQRHSQTPGVSIALEQIGEAFESVHGEEIVGWLAMEPGTGVLGGHEYSAFSTPDVVTHEAHVLNFNGRFSTRPYLFASIASFDGVDAAALRIRDISASSSTVFIEEEQCSDAEIQHTTEIVNFIALEEVTGHGFFRATATQVESGVIAVDGTMSFACSTDCVVYANGAQIAAGDSRSEISAVDVHAVATGHQFVIGVSATASDEEVYAFVADVILNGDRVVTGSDSWKCTGTAHENWYAPNYDDSAWVAAAEQVSWASGLSAVSRVRLSNGDFETGDSADDAVYAVPADWTGEGVVLVPNGNPAWGALFSNSGENFVALRRARAFVEQRIVNLIPGTIYSVNFLASHRPGSPGLQHASEDCWIPCHEASGSCAWCGDGKCCRLRWGVEEDLGDCQAEDGTSENRHECVPLPMILAVFLDGETLLPDFQPADMFTRYTAQFTASSSSAVVRFENVSPDGDQSVFLDDITVMLTSSAPQCKASGLFFEAYTDDSVEAIWPPTLLSGTGGMFDDVWNGMQPTLAIREMTGAIWYPTDEDFMREIPDFNVDDKYMMRWRGTIEIVAAGEYSFRTRSDDGSMLYIDERLVVNNDGLHSMRDAVGSIDLAVGAHDITIAFYENDGDAGLQVSWTPTPGGNFVRLSSDVLSHTINCPCADSLLVEIYMQSSATMLSQTRNKFGSLWDGMRPGATRTQSGHEFLYPDDSAFLTRLPGLSDVHNFMVRWRGLISIPIQGEYTFQTRSDDGSMLYIDHQVVVDNDGEHSAQTRSGAVVLSAGYREITIFYSNKLGDAVLEVYWTPMPGSALAPLAADVLSNGFGCPADVTDINGNHQFSGISPDAQWIWSENPADQNIFCRLDLPLPLNTVGKVPVGEQGYSSFSPEWRTIDLQGQYTSPVVIVGPLTSMDQTSSVVTLRIRNLRFRAGGCTGWCFDARLQEPGQACTSDEHTTESASWTVLESGAHMTDEGAVFEVGKDSVSPPGVAHVRFQGGFSSADIVILPHVQTYADAEYVTARLQSHTSLGFAVVLEGVGSASVNPHRLTEQVGWIAVQSGKGRIGGREYKAFLSAQNVADTVSEIDFEMLFGAVPLVFATIATYAGSDAAIVRQLGTASQSSAQVFIQEDRCVDAETDHAYESVGVLVIEPSSANILTANAVSVVHSDVAFVGDVSSEDPITHHLTSNPTSIELGTEHVSILFRSMTIPHGVLIRDSHIRFRSSADFMEAASEIQISGVLNGGCTGFETLSADCSDIVYDAAAANLDGPTVATNHVGYSGEGFVVFGGVHDSVTFHIDNCEEGNYVLNLYYALASGARSLQITVNGVVVEASLSFHATGSWTSWKDRHTSAHLNAGLNEITVSPTGQSGPNFDGIRITPVGQLHRPFGAVLTSATVEWKPSRWAAGAEYWTPDLSSVIEEVVSGSNWTSGSNLCILFSPMRRLGSCTASTYGLATDAAPYFSALLDPCQSVHCGLHGVCELGVCVCMGGFFGSSCELPPGPTELCDPIRRRFLPQTLATCAEADGCSPNCAAATLRLGSTSSWAWSYFASLCNLEGAIRESGGPVGCEAPPMMQNISMAESIQYPGCAWDGVRCVARLDATVVSSSIDDYSANNYAGVGLSACFGAHDEDSCHIMEWCSWRAGSNSCGPRIYSPMSVIPAAFLQQDPLYDATLDPQAQLLHLAEECGQHSERVCGHMHSCTWSATHLQCILSDDTGTALLQPPSCSALWGYAAECRGRDPFACVGTCEWSGAGQACLLSAINAPDSAGNCGLESDCHDDNWGLLAAVEMTCTDILNMTDCNTDLNEVFEAWPLGVHVSAICQASCGLCDAQFDGCADQLDCAAVADAWTTLSKTDHCTDVSTTDEQVGETVLPWSLGPARTFKLTVQSSSDAIVVLTGLQPSDYLFEVALGASENTRTVIRRLSRRPNTSFRPNGMPVQDQFFAQEVATSNTPDVLSLYEARSFWIDAALGLIRVGHGTTVGRSIILQWQDPARQEPARVALRSGTIGQRTWGLSGAEWSVCFPVERPHRRCSGNMARTCPQSCGLCARSQITNRQRVSQRSYNMSGSRLTSAAVGQTPRGLAAVLAGWQLCSTRDGEECTSPCSWVYGGRCGLAQSQAVELFLGPARATPVGTEIVEWFHRGAGACKTHGDKDTCEAAQPVDVGASHRPPQAGTLSLDKAQLAAVTLSIFVLVWIVISVAVVRKGTKRKMQGPSEEPTVPVATSPSAWVGAAADLMHRSANPIESSRSMSATHDTASRMSNAAALEPWPCTSGPLSVGNEEIWGWNDFYLDDVEAVFSLPDLSTEADFNTEHANAGNSIDPALQHLSRADCSSPFDSDMSASSPERDYTSDGNTYETSIDGESESSVVGDSPQRDGMHSEDCGEEKQHDGVGHSLSKVQTVVAEVSNDNNTVDSVAQQKPIGWVRPRSNAVTVKPVENSGVLDNDDGVRFGSGSDYRQTQQLRDPYALTMCAPCTPAVGVGVAAATQVKVESSLEARSDAGRGRDRSSSRGKQTPKKRKLTSKTKQEVTGAVYLLCCSPELSVLEHLSRQQLLKRFQDAADSKFNLQRNGASPSASVGALLRYGTDSKRAKLVLASVLNDLLRALQWDFAQPADAPVKWGTIQRDIRWKYIKREGNDSVYIFDDPPHEVERLARAVAARVPGVNIPGVIRESLARVAAQVDGGKDAPSGQSPMEQSTWDKPLYYCHVKGCGYATPERRYMLGHMRVHSGVKQFVCPHPGCGYASYSSQHLTRHARVHSGERPYRCTWEGCGYAATQKGHLQSHMLKHTGQRPFKCTVPGCNFACTRSWHLARHTRKHEQQNGAVTCPAAGPSDTGVVGAVTARSIIKLEPIDEFEQKNSTRRPTDDSDADYGWQGC